MQTVIERPELGACVRKLDLGGFNPRGDWRQNIQREPQKDQIEMLVGACNHLQADWKRRYLTGAVSSPVNSLIMLLITLTPNLEALTLRATEEEGLEGLDLLWERDSLDIRSYGYLTNLKTFGIVWGTGVHKSISDLIHLMHLPKLDVLYMSGANEHAPGCPPFDLLRPASLSITTLELAGSTLHQNTVRQIVRAYKCLKVFCFSAALNATCTYDYLLGVSDIVSVLEPHQNSLREIKLNTRDLKSVHGSPDGNQYGSFTAFTSLKFLELEQCGIQDVAGLPDSLERLSLISCNRPVYSFLANLISKSKNGRLPLKSLSIRQVQAEFGEENQDWILGIGPLYEWLCTKEGQSAMIEACRRLDNLIKTADFSVEIFDCTAWEVYVAEHELKA
ncbi:hypothetical protein AbraCBS73388_002143 [Aspergillus brasiliensis]|uniref:Uncharacterized protein n=1 Tax=Aspergillus brasiliensis TaxID=319629 RepID=A0A9W5YYS8_9EURO|nr:hypothetical protein AbraCBS73388_002143 [Aspergillus brasiliensis]